MVNEMRAGLLIAAGRPAPAREGRLAARSVVCAEVEHRVGMPNGAARNSIRGGNSNAGLSDCAIARAPRRSGRTPMSDILNLPRPAWMSEDVVLLEDQARRFIAAEFVPHLEKWHEDHFYPREVWTKAGEAGLLCASMPEEYGGAGGTFAHEAVIDREYSLAGFDTFGAPLHSGIVAPYILHYGTEEQKRRWLPKLATGETGRRHRHERARHRLRPARRAHQAKKSGNGYVLNGSKTFITNGQHANLIIVVAKTDPKQGAKGVSLMVVETADATGFRARPQAEKARHGFRRHLGIVLRGGRAAGGKPARHRGRPGLLSADEGIAAGAADRRRRTPSP